MKYVQKLNVETKIFCIEMLIDCSYRFEDQSQSQGERENTHADLTDEQKGFAAGFVNDQHARDCHDDLNAAEQKRGVGSPVEASVNEYVCRVENHSVDALNVEYKLIKL